MTDHFFVLTGGPGSGKSSLVDALAGEGFRHQPEAGRAIIQDQVAIGGTALPWADRAMFAELMLAWDLRSHREARALPGPILFDRGIVDVLGYLALCGLPVPEHARRAAELYRYNPRILIAPPWPEIFRQDAERRQTVEEAEATYRAVLRVYVDFGYEPIELPRLSVAERVRFVRSIIR